MAAHKLTASRCGSPPPGRTHRRTCIDDAHRRERIGDHRSVHARHRRAVSPTKWASRASGTSRTGAPSITSGEGKDRSGKRCSVRTEPHASRTHPPAQNPGHTSRPVRRLPGRRQRTTARSKQPPPRRPHEPQSVRRKRSDTAGASPVPRSTDRRRTAHQVRCRGTRNAPGGPARPGASQRDRRASIAARQAERRPANIARGATTRAQPSVRVRGSFTQGPSRSPRLARVRRPARRHRARRDASRFADPCRSAIPTSRHDHRRGNRHEPSSSTDRRTCRDRRHASRTARLPS